MSFLSKRSRSTRSFIRGGEDQLSVRRIEADVATGTRRNSTESCDSSSPAPPYVDVTDYALHESCVLRKFPKHKSSHLRFLAWVAYTRKFTDEAITEDERRTCPLLWCRTVFRDQETMLQHVFECEHLSKGLYWCFHCQRPERVGKYQCKRCQGMPSRTDRLTSVAKRIFSKLGTKHNRSQAQGKTPEIDMALAKCPDSKSLQQSEYPDIYDAGPVEEWGQYPNAPSDIGTRDWTSSLELPDTQIAEMSGLSCALELNAGPDNWLTPYAAPQQDWFLPEPPAMNVNPAPRSSKRPETMLPPLKTQSLSPNHMQPTYPSNSWVEPMVATIISPLSATERFASFHGVSPTDTEISGRSFFTNDSGYTSGTFVSSMSGCSTGNFELNPSLNEPRGTKRSREFAEEAEQNKAAGQSASKGIKSVVGSVGSNHSPSRCPSTKKPKLQSPHWSTAPSLVQAFSEILDAHITHTKETFRQMPSTPVTTELLAMSRTSMVSIGLEALAGIIEGRNPTAIVQVFAFTHIAYAFAIAVDHDEIKVHTQEWFQDSLSWVEDLGSERQRNSYTEIVRAIWQPVDSLREKSLPKLFSQGDKENRLFLACKHFLDAVESFGPQPEDLLKNERIFDFSQPLFARQAKTRILDELIKSVSIEAFIEDVVKVEKRLNRGHIANVRELELELMCAGKLASQSELAYTRFLDHVTYLCNALYADDPTKARSVYHIKDIALVKRLLPEEMYCDYQAYDRDFELELEDDLPVGCEIMFMRDEAGSACVDEFDRDIDEVLNLSVPASTASIVSSTARQSPARVVPSLQAWSPTSKSTFNPTPAPTPAPNHIRESPASTKELRCSICDYIPTGEEKWKASNLRRHKRTQHPELNGKKAWKCKWPDCGSVFTRSDNLRSHVRDKGHELVGKGKERAIEEQTEPEPEAEGVNESEERPLKRRKGDLAVQ